MPTISSTMSLILLMELSLFLVQKLWLFIPADAASSETSDGARWTFDPS